MEIVEQEVAFLESLTEIETSIKGHLATMARGTQEAFDARIAIGYDLLRAREFFGEDDKSFGKWAKASFRWSKQWRQVLMASARNEEVVRSLLATQVAGKEDPNFKELVEKASGKKSSKPPKSKGKSAAKEPIFHTCPNCGSQVECKKVSA
jgi:hypothetical protein